MTVVVDDCSLKSTAKLEIINAIGARPITHVIHDIDGTHSLIRDWPPVMSLSIYWAMTCGLAEDFDSDKNLAALIERVGSEPLEETDQFCIESAGLSALTQMEYGIRRAVQKGNIPEIAGYELTDQAQADNAEIVKRIWNGEERFEDITEPAALLDFINEKTPRLFRLYEKILNGACRDKNTAIAWDDPERFRVPGSMEFMRYLYGLGLVNYFVTGAVIYEEGGMFEEVKAVGFDVGRGKMVEELRGSSWDTKLPKDEVMLALYRELGVNPAQVLVVGDGRSEIKAGTDMGSVTMSRLPADAARQRELHIGFGANYIVEDYTDPILRELIRQG